MEELNDSTSVEALRRELLGLVEKKLNPIAQKYRYSESPLDANIRWSPIVLILGNYSSGKSTLINEILGADIQKTGQAPTDDSFTVISYGEKDGGTNQTVSLVEEREGGVLLNDPQFPFDGLKKHGSRFASHFRLKRVNAPLLKQLAIIDTPGMLDSLSERDRGYEYQEVVGELAKLADLILIMFDPHKAGTVQEAYHSLRRTLPQNSFEDRLIFVLNRIDECGNLTDLLRVYGTLCWNLSQMTGRKDIPRILLTYSQIHGQRSEKPGEQYLHLLENQRTELRQAISDAPLHRLDHMASFVEMHSKGMSHLLEALLAFARDMRAYQFKWSFFAIFFSMIFGAAMGMYGFFVQPLGVMSETMAITLGIGAAITAAIGSIVVIQQVFSKMHRRRIISAIDGLTDIKNPSRQESWKAIREKLLDYLKQNPKMPSVGVLRKEFDTVEHIHRHEVADIRSATHR